MGAIDFFKKMKQAMDDQAVEVWNMVEYSRASGYRLRLGEVTLTELNYYRLRDFWTKGVFIETNEPYETSTGADWEWIIGHGAKWVQIRVQAKIVDRKGSFRELGHPPTARRQQMDRLIDPPAADVACRWMPLYVFYSADPPANAPGVFGTTPDRKYGCSAKLAHEVRDVYGPHGKSAVLTAKQHLSGSQPWSAIFDGLISRLQAGEQLDSILDSLVTESFVKLPRSIDDFWDEQVTGGTCHKDLPDYLQAIIDSRQDDFDEASLARLEVKSAQRPPRDEARPKTSDNIEIGRALTEVEIESLGSRDDSLEPLPTRTIERKAPNSSVSYPSLPKFVAVMDVENLPDI